MTRWQALRRRWAATVAVFLATVLVASVALLAPGERGVASSGIMLGATPEPIDGLRQDGVAEIEDQLGRKLDMVRVFESWESAFPSAFHNQMVEQGRLMVVSIRPKRADGTKIQWRDIADAAPGSQLYNEMVTWAQKLRDLDVPVWFALHHEPEAAGSAGYGDAADFIAAWRAFVGVIRAQGADNVRFAWIMTAWSFETAESDARYAGKWYPGDDYVDLIGSDAYNFDKCRDSATDYWRPLEEIIEPQREFGLDHPGKELFLAEVASTEDPSNWGGAKAAWVTAAKELFQKPGWEQFVAVSFFDVTDPSYPNCHWPIDSSPEALAALVDLGADPFYGGGDGGGGSTTSTTQPTPTTQPSPGAETGTFVDVPATNPFFTQIEWLADEGITRGCNPPVNDRFCPDQAVTRGQMAAFLVRALGYSDDGGGDWFVDDDASVFAGSIDKLATAGVTRGCNPPVNDRFCPDQAVTRGEMAAFLYRALS